MSSPSDDSSGSDVRFFVRADNNNHNNNNNNNHCPLPRIVSIGAPPASAMGERTDTDDDVTTSKDEDSSSCNDGGGELMPQESPPPYELEDLVFILPSEKHNNSMMARMSSPTSPSCIPPLNFARVYEQKKIDNDDGEDSPLGVPEDQLYINNNNNHKSKHDSVMMWPSIFSQLQEQHLQQEESSAKVDTRDPYKPSNKLQKRVFYDDLVRTGNAMIEDIDDQQYIEVIAPYSTSMVDEEAGDFRDLGTGVNPAKLHLIPKEKRRKSKLNRYDIDNILNFGREPGARFPLTVLALTCVQIGILLACMVKFKVAPIMQNPMIGPPVQDVYDLGGKNAARMKNNKEVYRLISSFVFHTGIVHLLFTLLWQLSLVLRTERNWGWVRIFCVYVLSGIGGNLMSSVFLSESISVGATSCLIGILSALIAEFALNWFVSRKRPWKPMLALLVQVILFLAMGYLPTIDNFANFGGVFCGFFAGLVFAPRKLLPNMRVERIVSKVVLCVRLLALLLLMTFYAVLLGVLFGAIKWKCKACYLLSPGWDDFPQQ